MSAAIPVETLYIGLSAMLFGLGALGFVIRRSSIVAFMCVEIMLNAANLALVAFSSRAGNLDGQVAVFFVMVVAAAEAAVGLAIIISLFRMTRSVETTEAGQLRW
jgi:NADH-quinone oxidoreductase subunit K